MTITYRGEGVQTADGTTGTTLSVPYPTSAELGGSPLAAGDLIILFVGCGSPTPPTNPSGFTNAVSQAGGNGSQSPSLIISYRVATGSESGSLTVTTPSTTSKGQMFVFAGVDSTTPMDTTPSSAAIPGTTVYDIPGVTTTTTGVCLFYSAITNSSAGGSYTPPTNPAAFTELNDNTISWRSTAGYLIWSGSGATGTVNLVTSSNTRGAVGMIALRPAPSGPTNYNGTTSRTGTGSLTADGVVARASGASRAGVGVLSAAGAVGRSGGAALAGTGDRTASGSLGRSSGAALAGTGSLFGVGQAVAGAGATLSGLGAFAASGVVARASGAALAGMGELGADARLSVSAAVTLVGTGTRDVIYRLGTSSSAGLVGTATVSAGGVVGRASGAALAGAGALETDGFVMAPGQGTINLLGDGTITAAGVVGRSGSAALAGTGTRTAAGLVGKRAGAVLAGTGSAASSALLGRTAAAAVVGVGTRTASGNVGRLSAAGLVGSGTLLAGGVVGTSSAAVLAGAATLAAEGESAAILVLLGEATLLGTGALDTSGIAVVFVPVTPPERRFIILSEDRTTTFDKEDRRKRFSVENRTTVVHPSVADRRTTMSTHTKDPEANLDYVWDWGRWLEPGDRITSHTTTPSSTDITTSSSHTDTDVTVWVDGGVLGQAYNVTVQIQTLGGRTDERTQTFLIRNR